MTTTRLSVAAAAEIAVSVYRCRRGADGMRIRQLGTVLRRCSSGSTRIRKYWSAWILNMLGLRSLDLVFMIY